MNNNYCCEKCKYSTKIKQSFERHLLSKKHIEDKIKSINELNNYICLNCNKTYKYRSGLCNHKKTCIVKSTTNEKKSNVVKELQEDIKFIKALLSEKKIKPPDGQIIQQPINNIMVENQYTTTTTTNNNFNINIFLEGCKDAINYVDFIESLRGSITITNVQNIGNYGYVKGYTLNIVDKLRKFPLYQRPIHYHEPEKTIYIRDENEWKSNDNEVKEIINGSTFTIDRITSCKISGLKNTTKTNFDKEMNEINIHGGLSRENTNEQIEILNSIINHIKVP